MVRPAKGRPGFASRESTDVGGKVLGGTAGEPLS